MISIIPTSEKTVGGYNLHKTQKAETFFSPQIQQRQKEVKANIHLQRAAFNLVCCLSTLMSPFQLKAVASLFSSSSLP